MQTFTSLVSGIDWSDVYYCQEVNKTTSKLVTRLSKCYQESFPLIKLSRRCAHDKKWITPGIKASVKKKSKLYKKWRESRNESDGENFFKNIDKFLNMSGMKLKKVLS